MMASRPALRFDPIREVTMSGSNKPIDPIALAGAVQLEELAVVAGRLAKRIRSGEALPPVAVARLTVEANRAVTRFQRHESRLQR